MTELETRLMDALKALSTQWDADQQQHVEELDILRARIDELAQQVTDSATQHEQTRRYLGATRDRLTGAAAAARHAGGDLDGAVRTHHQGLQDARRLVEAGKNRIEQRIEQTRDPGPEPLGLSRPSHRTTLDELEHPSDFRPGSSDIS